MRMCLCILSFAGVICLTYFPHFFSPVCFSDRVFLPFCSSAIHFLSNRITFSLSLFLSLSLSLCLPPAHEDSCLIFFLSPLVFFPSLLCPHLAIHTRRWMRAFWKKLIREERKERKKNWWWWWWWMLVNKGEMICREFSHSVCVLSLSLFVCILRSSLFVVQ